MKVLERRRTRRMIRKMNHGESMKWLRMLVFSGSNNQALMRQLAERAYATDPDCPAAQRYLSPLRAGRRVGVTSGPITKVDGVDVETIDAINAIYE